MKVPPEILDEIRARVDLVDLIGAYVPLKRAGERWKGLCPFHQEKTPSFTVSPRLRIFHCFGCHTGGDAFEFLRRHDKLDFPEAVRFLADRVGVELPRTPEARGDAGVREGLYRLLEWAARRYEAWLWERGDADRARRYLEGRGIAPEMARRFRLGYAPEGWDHLLAAARAEGTAPEALLGAGLVLPRQTGSGWYDRFRGRLIFPIADGQGRVIAFGGRALAGEEPKYLNSPETPLYQKGHTLYALHLARDRMATTHRALLVEGYVDCLMAHQAGFAEGVAVLGTALTPHHLAILRRHADEAILFFDADRAGAEAARRAEDLLEQSADPHWWALERKRETPGQRGFRIRVATLPPGDDPDTFLRREGSAALDARCADARGLLLYALDRALADEDTATPRGRTTGIARIALLLAKVQDPDEAIDLGREAARRLGVDPSDLWNQAQALRATPRPAPGAARPAAGAGPAAFERDLVQALLQLETARTALLGLADPQDVTHPGLRRILEALREHPDEEAAALVHRLADEADRALLTRLVLESRDWPPPAELVPDLRRRLELRAGRRGVRLATLAIMQAPPRETPGLDALQADLQERARRVRAMLSPNPDPREDVRS